MLQRVVLTPPLDELEDLTDAEVRASYQVANEAGQTWHVNFYRDEMRRRESASDDAAFDVGHRRSDGRERRRRRRRSPDLVAQDEPSYGVAPSSRAR